MTNEQIIFQERIGLMNDGIIGTTGRKIKVTYQKDGEEVTEIIDEPEEIHTFADWKKRGYFVNKGEKAIAKFPIWNHSKDKFRPMTKEEADAMNSIIINADGSKYAEGDPTIEKHGRYYMKESYFFKVSQTSAQTKQLPAVI